MSYQIKRLLILLVVIIDTCFCCLSPKPYNYIILVISGLILVILGVLSFIVIKEELKKEQQNNPY